MSAEIIMFSSVTTKNGDKWEATMLEKDRMFQGVITKNGQEQYRGSQAYSEANVKRWLNTKIAAFNTQFEIKPPLPTVSYNALKRRKKGVIEPTIPVEKTAVTCSDATKSKAKEITVPVVSLPPLSEQPAASEKQPTKPRRKPFSPYGLSGYLVDKNGNIRLMLDRKANAHTIVLNAEMFGALAEMVDKTRAQDK